MGDSFKHIVHEAIVTIIRDTASERNIKCLSEYPRSAKGDEGTGDVKEGKIVLGLLLPAHQDATKAIHPAVASFHNPATTPLARLLRRFFHLFTPNATVGGEARFGEDLSHVIIVGAFVRSHPLRLLLAGLWSLNHNALNCVPHRLHIVTIRAVDRRSYRNSIALGQQNPFDAVFATVDRV